jgi:hypothetical protein
LVRSSLKSIHADGTGGLLFFYLLLLDLLSLRSEPGLFVSEESAEIQLLSRLSDFEVTAVLLLAGHLVNQSFPD